MSWNSDVAKWTVPLCSGRTVGGKLLKSAKELGAERPFFTETGPLGPVVILDMESGRTWRVELREF